MVQHLPNPDATAASSKNPQHDTVSRVDDQTAGFVASGPDPDKLDFLGSVEAAGELGRLAHYRVLKELGRGGMGCVLLAEDMKLQRNVALKVMLPRFARDAKAKARFLREARAAAKIRHDNVITIFQVDEDRGVPFIALEFLEGAPLDKYLKDKGALPLPTAVRIAREMADGLAAAHKQGLIHRDIKPGNVWLEAPKGKVKILDFGLARLEADDTHLTQSGAIIGTPAFMAPEQARGEKVDGRCDLFSLGVVLYRLSTGKQPFSGSTTMAVLTAIAVDTPPPARAVNPKVPESLEKVLAKLLEKDPARRYATAKEVVADLNGVLKELAQATKAEPSHSVTLPPPPRDERPSPAREARPAAGGRKARRPVLLVALALGFFAVSVGAWQIVIRIQNKDGTETRIEVPEGSKVVVEDPGKKASPPPKEGKAPDKEKPPAFKPVPAGPVELAVAAGTEPLAGLLLEPPPLPGVKRWNVDTRYDRGVGTNACWSPDSKYIATAAGRQLRIYQAPEMKLVRILPDHENGFGPVAWSPDGKWLASADGALVRLHDPATGKAGPVLKGHTADIRSLAWLADSRHLATAQSLLKKEDVFLWSMAGALVGKVTPGHLVVWLYGHPRESVLVLEASKDIVSWDLKTRKQLASASFPDIERIVGWRKDGKTLLIRAGTREDRKNYEWDPLRGDLPSERPDLKGIGFVLSSPGTDLVLASEGNGNYFLFDWDKGKRGGNFKILGNLIGFSQDGRWLLSGGRDGFSAGSLQLFSVAQTALRPVAPRLEHMTRLAWNPRSDVLATDFGAARRDWTIALWDLKGPTRWQTFGPHRRVFNNFTRALVWDGTGQRLLTSGWAYGGGEGLRLWNPEMGTVERALDDFKPDSNFAGSPDGRWFAFYSREEGKVALLDPKTYAVKEWIETPKKYDGPPVRFLGDPPALYVDNQRWDFQKRRWEQAFQEGWPSPDGKMVVDGTGTAPILEELPNGPRRKAAVLPDKQTIPVRGGNNKAHWYAWSPDGQTFATRAGRSDVALYRRDGTFLRFLKTPAAVYTFQFAPDGSPRAAGLAEDHTLRVWNTDTGRQLFCGVQLSADQGAILDDQGDIRCGDPATVEQELIYLVEYQDGRTAVLTPTEFRQQFRKGAGHPPAIDRKVSEAPPACQGSLQRQTGAGAPGSVGETSGRGDRRGLSPL